jgi:hypothetical protein
MKTIQEIMMETRNHCVRYGNIQQDNKYERNGNNYRDTTFIIDGMQVYVEMCNGEILHITYN